MKHLDLPRDTHPYEHTALDQIRFQSIIDRAKNTVKDIKNSKLTLEQHLLDFQIRSYLMDYYLLGAMIPADRDMAAARLHSQSTLWLKENEHLLHLYQSSAMERVIDASFLAWRYPTQELIEIDYSHCTP